MPLKLVAPVVEKLQVDRRALTGPGKLFRTFLSTGRYILMQAEKRANLTLFILAAETAFGCYIEVLKVDAAPIQFTAPSTPPAAWTMPCMSFVQLSSCSPSKSRKNVDRYVQRGRARAASLTRAAKRPG